MNLEQVHPGLSTDRHQRRRTGAEETRDDVPAPADRPRPVPPPEVVPVPPNRPITPQAVLAALRKYNLDENLACDSLKFRTGEYARIVRRGNDYTYEVGQITSGPYKVVEKTLENVEKTVIKYDVTICGVNGDPVSYVYRAAELDILVFNVPGSHVGADHVLIVDVLGDPDWRKFNLRKVRIVRAITPRMYQVDVKKDEFSRNFEPRYDGSGTIRPRLISLTQRRTVHRRQQSESKKKKKHRSIPSNLSLSVPRMISLRRPDEPSRRRVIMDIKHMRKHDPGVTIKLQREAFELFYRGAIPAGNSTDNNGFVMQIQKEINSYIGFPEDVVAYLHLDAAKQRTVTRLCREMVESFGVQLPLEFFARASMYDHYDETEPVVDLLKMTNVATLSRREGVDAIEAEGLALRKEWNKRVCPFDCLDQLRCVRYLRRKWVTLAVFWTMLMTSITFYTLFMPSISEQYEPSLGEQVEELMFALLTCLLDPTITDKNQCKK